MDKRFMEVANDYVSTGGGIMVDITTIYDCQCQRTLYMFVNDDTMTLATYNFAQNDVPSEMRVEDCILYSMNTSDFTVGIPNSRSMERLPDEYTWLFNNGLQSYIKNTCEESNQPRYMAVENLPLDLRRMVSDDYERWLAANDQLVATDGTQILQDLRYAAETTFDVNGQAAVKFKRLLEKMRADADIDDSHLDVFENEKIHLIINGQVFTLEMCAAVWNGLIDYADFIISEQ